MTSKPSTEHSEGSVELHENPYLREGVEKIRRAKKEDSKGHLREAVHFYELGAGLLLDAARRGQGPNSIENYWLEKGLEIPFLLCDMSKRPFFNIFSM